MTGADLVDTLDLAGTLAFAISGAIVGARRGMDLFGVLVLAFVTAVAGGVLRDLLVGFVPPAAIRDWRPLALSIAAGLFAFRYPLLFEKLRTPVRLFDAAGLGVFAATGAEVALDHGVSPLMASALGMLSGIGGGMVRDVLVARTPIVLRADVYALAALAAGAVVALGRVVGAPDTATLPLAVALCFWLRMMAIYRGWRLPRAAQEESSVAILTSEDEDRRG
jgi:uncharacterized membrane protein YeiH